MPKIGDIRDDGWILLNFRGEDKREQWVSPECFSKAKGHDWHERRARMDKNVADRAKARELSAIRKLEMEATKDERLAIQKQKRAERARIRFLELPTERKEERNTKRREKHQSDPVFRAGENSRSRARWEAAAPIREAKREAKRQAKAEKERLAAIARASRLAVIAENKAKREAAAALRPPRKILTDDQRLEAKRQDKRNQKHRRRAILRGQEAKATRSQIEALRAKAKGICRYCHGKFKSLTLDHITPLARGGTHTIDNICFACHDCNSRKSDLPAHDFCKAHGLLLV